MKTVCVYCGSSPGQGSHYLNAATMLATELIKNNIRLVYGGASVGVMGRIADSVLSSGGEVIGVMPRALIEKEVSHPGLTQLIEVESMHERKAKMADLSDGFIAMPGGMGTLEELFEVLTWAQLGFHDKPIALLNINGYYDKLIQFLDHAVDQQFMRKQHRDILLVEENPEWLLSSMAAYRPKKGDKWIGREQL